MIALLTACLFFAILVRALNRISKSACVNCVRLPKHISPFQITCNNLRFFQYLESIRIAKTLNLNLCIFCVIFLIVDVLFRFVLVSFTHQVMVARTPSVLPSTKELLTRYSFLILLGQLVVFHKPTFSFIIPRYEAMHQ